MVANFFFFGPEKIPRHENVIFLLGQQGNWSPLVYFFEHVHFFLNWKVKKKDKKKKNFFLIEHWFTLYLYLIAGICLYSYPDDMPLVVGR